MSAIQAIGTQSSVRSLYAAFGANNGINKAVDPTEMAKLLALILSALVQAAKKSPQTQAPAAQATQAVTRPGKSAPGFGQAGQGNSPGAAGQMQSGSTADAGALNSVPGAVAPARKAGAAGGASGLASAGGSTGAAKSTTAVAGLGAASAKSKTASAGSQGADVLVGTYDDPADLANPGPLVNDPRIGLFSNQLGFVQDLNDNQRTAIANAWQGKTMGIERASYDNYGPDGNNGLRDQFTQFTGGKENMAFQAADLNGGGDLSPAQQADNVARMQSDIATQKALGNTVIPVVGPNSPAGQSQSYADGFASPEFDSWRALAKQAGGLMFDSPPASMQHLPGYEQFYDDATKWLHANGLKSYWYGAAGGQPNYLADVKGTIDHMNQNGTNPDVYVMSGYNGGADESMAVDMQAAQIVLDNTTPV